MQLSTLIRTRLEHIRNERRTRAEIEASQLKKFRRLAAHAAKHSPYYREIVEARGIELARCVPQDFPVLTKTMLMDNFDRIVTDRSITHAKITEFLATSKDPAELYQDRYIVIYTSGTTGEVGYFIYNCEDWLRGVTNALRVSPPSLAKRRLAFFGASAGHYTGAAFAASIRRLVLRWAYDVEVYEINDPLEPTLEGLNAFQPTILVGYPSSLTTLAEAQLNGQLAIAPAVAQCSGEPVLPADREKVERAFGVPLIDVYSSTEHLIMGASPPEYGGMYLFEDNLIFELKSDHTLVTNLFNKTLPLIRYRMNDMLAHREDTCSRLPFAPIEILGRSEYTPVFVNERGEEDSISPRVLGELFAPGVRRYQFMHDSRSSCSLRVCLERGLDENGREDAVAAFGRCFDEVLAQKAMRNVDYRVEVVDEMPVDPKTRKFRLIAPRYGDLDPGGATEDFAEEDAPSARTPFGACVASDLVDNLDARRN